jgi:hypothetical protein
VALPRRRADGGRGQRGQSWPARGRSRWVTRRRWPSGKRMRGRMRGRALALSRDALRGRAALFRSITLEMPLIPQFEIFVTIDSVALLATTNSINIMTIALPPDSHGKLSEVAAPTCA